MGTTDFYILKFQFEGEDVETGEMKKQKREILAECTCYTEAEKLAYSIISEEQWDKFSHSKPEIVRIKVSDLRTNDCVLAEQDMFDGYAEMYLDEEDAHFYQVNISDPYTDDNGNEKFEKTSMFIPADSTGNAESYALKLYKNAFVSAAKMVSFRSAFVTQDTLEKIQRSYENM